MVRDRPEIDGQKLPFSPGNFALFGAGFSQIFLYVAINDFPLAAFVL
jgi:hypothetical protein